MLPEVNQNCKPDVDLNLGQPLTHDDHCKRAFCWCNIISVDGRVETDSPRTNQSANYLIFERHLKALEIIKDNLLSRLVSYREPTVSQEKYNLRTAEIAHCGVNSIQLR